MGLSASEPTYTAKPLSYSDIGEIEITYLGGGFMLGTYDRSVIVDGLWRADSTEGLSEEYQTSLLEGLEPFHRITALAFTSADKQVFDAGLVVEYLDANPHAALRAAPAVMQAINQVKPISEYRGRVAAIWPEPGQILKQRTGIITTEYFRLPVFNPKERRELGHIFHLALGKVLHLGAADPNLDDFDRLGMASRKFAAALVPYWFLDTEQGREILRDHIHTETLILTHLPPERLSDRERPRLRGIPEVWIPKRSMDSGRF